MLIHGNFIIHEDKNSFIMWGESRFRNNTKTDTKTVIPLLPGLENVNDLVNILKLDGTVVEKVVLVPKRYFESERNNDIENRDLDVLVKYRIKGVIYQVEDVIRLLWNLGNYTENYQGVNISTELRYWIIVFEYVHELAIKQKYYPTIEFYENRIVTNWSLFTESVEDKQRMNLIIKNNPPISRAYFDLKEKDFIPFGKKEILKKFANYILSHYINMIEIGENHENVTPLMCWVDSIFNSSKSLKKEYSMEILQEYKAWFNSFINGNCSKRFVTCFKVVPSNDQPQNEVNKTWKIEFMLQDSEDKSLIFSAREIWDEKHGLSKYFEENYISPKESLLEDLNFASRIYPVFTRSFNAEKPVECLLKDEEAYDFMVNYSKELKENDFSIIIPSFWNSKSNFNVDLKVKEKKKFFNNSKVKSDLNLKKILEYDWKISLGDIELTKKEFKQLAMLKVPIVNLRGKWIHLTDEQIKGFKVLWKQRYDKDIKMNELLKYKLNKDEFLPGFKLSRIEGADNITNMINALSDIDKIEEVKSPESLNAQLRDYQKHGYSWMKYLRERNIGACLADDMGLGKTIQLISLLLYEREQKLTTKPTLLVCPTSLIGNWKKEMEKFAPKLDVIVHHGGNRKKDKEFEKSVDGKDVVLTTYALAQRDEILINKIDWAGLVLDEAQNIKNSFTKQTKSIKRINSDYRIALTGTPVENRLSELWSIVDFLNVGYLGSHKEFEKNYAIPIESGKESNRAEVLKKLISPFILRRLKTDPNIVKNLPEKNEMKVYCNLTSEQASLYEAIISGMLKKIEKKQGIERKGMVLAALGNLKQICNHPAQFLKDRSEINGRSGKLNMLIDMLRKIIDQNDKALIFTQFTEMGHFLEKAIKDSLDVSSLFLHGGIRRNKRDEMVKIFQSEDVEYPVFILSLKAGGVGITLTKANHVFHFDRWWNPAVENQATDRAFRLGQKKNVQVHKFICAGTLEEKIDMLIDSKKVLAESIVGTGEEWLTEMSDDELKDLMKLENKELIAD